MADSVRAGAQVHALTPGLTGDQGGVRVVRVVLHERLLEARRLDEQVVDAVPASAAMSGPGSPSSWQLRMSSRMWTSLMPATPSSDRGGPGEPDLDVASASREQSATSLSATSSPLRMMATRWQTRSTSDRMCDEKKIGAARSLALVHDVVERALHERVEPFGRLVEDGQLGVVLEGLDDAELLAHAPRSSRGPGGAGPARLSSMRSMSSSRSGAGRP